MEDTQTETKPARTKILKNGAVYDLDKGRIVANPGGGTTAITPEKSAEYKEQMAEAKREAIVKGAGKALERIQAGEWTLTNKLDVVEAIGEAVMQKALNPDNAKQVDAARFILQEAGMSESQAKPSEDAQQFASVGDLAALVRELRLAIQGQTTTGDVIDAPATDLPAITDTRSDE